MAGLEAGAPPIVAVVSCELAHIVAVARFVVIEGHLHLYPFVLIRAAVEGEEAGCLVGGILAIYAHFAAEEEQTVLTLPHLDHPVLVVVSEVNPHIVVFEQHIGGDDVIELGEAEVMLPAVLIVGVVVVVGVAVFVAEHLLFLKQILDGIAAGDDVHDEAVAQLLAVDGGLSDYLNSAGLFCGDKAVLVD